MTNSAPAQTTEPSAWYSRTGIHMLILAATVVALYLPALSHPFVFDDYGYLVNNPIITGFERFALLRNIPEFIRSQTPLLPDPDLAINFVLRPVSYLTFCINYALGGFDIRGYRLVNIIIHAANGILLYALIRRILTVAPDPLSPRGAQRAAFFAALLFLVNPLQTESVTYVIQRFTSFATTFYLACLLCYLYGQTSVTARQRHWNYIASIGILFIGMFVKEFLFTAPIMLVALEIIILRTTMLTALRRLVPHILCMPVIPVLMALIVKGQNHSRTNVAGMINVVNFEKIPPWHYFLTEMRALFSYARLLLLPYNQSIDHSYTRFTTLLNPEVIIALLLIALLLRTSWQLARRRADTLAHCCAFFILWYFIGFSIDSSVVPLPDLFSEHRSYFPSIGLICGLTLHLERLWAPRIAAESRFEVTLLVTLTLAVIIYSSLTVARNNTWRSLVSIWGDAVSKSSDNSRALHNLGVSYKLETGNLAKAEQCFRLALAATPPFRPAYFSLGKLLNATNRHAEALVVYREGVVKYYNEVEFVTEIGITYYLLNNYSAAKNTLENVVNTESGRTMTEAHHYLKLARQRLAEQQGSGNH